MPRSRFEPSGNWKDLRQFIAGEETKYGRAPSVYVRAGEGSIDLKDTDWKSLSIGATSLVHIAVVFNVQGFSGHTAAIAADQNRYHASPDTALQAAYEELENYEIDSDPDYVAELEDEWGDEWTSILTETFDARLWTLSARDAVRALEGTVAADYIDIYDED